MMPSSRRMTAENPSSIFRSILSIRVSSLSVRASVLSKRSCISSPSLLMSRASLSNSVSFRFATLPLYHALFRGAGISSCLQITCTMRGHISAWRATVVLLPFWRFLYTECLAPSRNNTHPCKRKCRSRSRRFIPSETRQNVLG